MLLFGVLTFLMSIIAYIFCLLVFGRLNKDPNVRQMVFICFIVKAVTWSPYLALEFYDTLFEQIYHDVHYQLNVIKPNSASRSVSPKLPKSNANASMRVDDTGTKSKVSTEQEKNEMSGTNTQGNEEDQ